MTIRFQFDNIVDLMRLYCDYKLFLTITILLGSCFLCSNRTFSRSLDDSLLIIRGGFEDGLYDLAASEALSFISRGKNHSALGEVYLILGYIEKHNGMHEKAYDYFVDATVSESSEIRLQGFYEAANVAWLQNKYSDAADNFKAVTEQDSHSEMTVQSRYWLVVSLYRAGRFTDLITSATDALEKEYNLSADQLIQVLYCRGKAFYYEKRFDEALTDLESVYATATRNLADDAAMTLANIHLELKRIKLADYWAQKRLEYGYSRQAHMIRYRHSAEHDNYFCARRHLVAIANHTTTPVDDKHHLLMKAALYEAEILVAAEKAWWIPLIDYCQTYPDSRYLKAFPAEMVRLNETQLMPAEFVNYTANIINWNPFEHGLHLAQLFLGAEEYSQALYWLVKHFSENDGKVPEPVDRLLFARLMAALGDQESASRELVGLDLASDSGLTNVGSVFEQADFFMKAGMYQRAAALYQQITVTPDIESEDRQMAMFYLANAWFQLDEWVLSGDIFKRFVSAYPDARRPVFEASMRRLSLSMLYSENWAELLEATEGYLKHFSETDYTGEMYYLKGLSEANLGKTDRALQSLGVALDLLSETELIESVKDAIKRLSEYQLQYDGNNR
jgi:hypothetical protein